MRGLERQQPQNDCSRLAEQVSLAEPSACNLEYIKVDIQLVDERWAGTDYMMDLVVHGSFAKTASAPITLGNDIDRNWSETLPINLEQEFQRRTIPVGSIQGLQLWSGKGDEIWVQELLLRGSCTASKRKVTMTKFSNLDKKMSTPDELAQIWSGDIKRSDWDDQSCDEIDSLEVYIRIKDEAWAGTDGTLKLVILGRNLGHSSHSIRLGQDMNRAWQHTETIRMSHLNGNDPSAFTGAAHITGLELRSVSGDEIKLQSIKVLAKCADSDAEAVVDHKWDSIDRWVKPDKGDYGKIWFGAIEANDWSWRPPCFEFDELKVAIHITDERWAGTDGQIDVGFNSGEHLDGNR
ncbi:hypothetical protein CDD83_10467 [Cordyceps sp. RAO-2017]|nr:hypothetical protein CDD83_10467 [Cordyceps sp. RAO-2017]